MSANKKHAVALVVFMAIIAVLSLMPMDTVEEKIKYEFKELLLIRSSLQNHFKVVISFSFIQNILHFPFYALLAFLWMGFLNKRRIGFKKAAFLALGIVFFFSLTFECLQFFLAERSASFADLLLNLSGSLSGVYIYRLLSKENRSLGEALTVNTGDENGTNRSTK